MITGMLIRTLLGFLERLKRSDLAAGVLPGLANTVPWFRGRRKNVTGSGNLLFELVPCPAGPVVVVMVPGTPY